MGEKILITSGPTREYLDPVRFLTNASSGKMGAALAAAALQAGYDVLVVTGPVLVDYPPEAQVVRVVSTAEMLSAAQILFPECRGLIAVAAPCDFRPVVFSTKKIAKEKLFPESSDENPKKSGNAEEDASGDSCPAFSLRLAETPDIAAILGKGKRPDQWSVVFALETDDHRRRALAKLARKRADLVVLNRPKSIGAETTTIEILASDGETLAAVEEEKSVAAKTIIAEIRKKFGFLSQDRGF